MPPSSGDAEHDREEACKGVTNCLGCEPPQDHGGSLSDGEGPYEPRESASDRLVRRAHATAHTTARRVHPAQDTIGGCERHDERNPKLGVALTKALVSPIRTWPDERRDERACPSLRNGRGDALPMRCRATATDQIMYGCRDHRFDMRSPCRDHDGLQIMVCRSVVSQDQIIEQTRPLAVALASFPALRSGTGSALRSTQPVVIAYRPARRPNYPINLISLIPRGGSHVQRAAAVARAPARRAEERHINAGRPATPEHETQRAVTRRSAYYTPCRPLASRASPSGSSQPGRGRGAARAR